jgi:hypothetical protein
MYMKQSDQSNCSLSKPGRPDSTRSPAGLLIEATFSAASCRNEHLSFHTKWASSLIKAGEIEHQRDVGPSWCLYASTTHIYHANIGYHGVLVDQHAAQFLRKTPIQADWEKEGRTNSLLAVADDG